MDEQEIKKVAAEVKRTSPAPDANVVTLEDAAAEKIADAATSKVSDANVVAITEPVAEEIASKVEPKVEDATNDMIAKIYAAAKDAENQIAKARKEAEEAAKTRVETVRQEVNKAASEEIAKSKTSASETQPPSMTSLIPTTTLEEDVNTAGQRRINLIWEISQAAIAILVVAANVFTATWIAITKSDAEFPVVLSSALFLITGFYFSRTNHQAVGGIGPKPSDSQGYVGR